MTIEFKKTSTVQSYDTTTLLAHDSIVRSDGSEEDTWRNATPADIVAALAALEEEEWVGVLRELDAGPPTAPSWLSDAAEALGEARPEDGAPLALNWTQVVRAIYDQRAERDEWRARAEKAERESRCFADSAAANLAELHRAEVRIEELMAELNKAERERDEARRELDRVRASLEVVRHDLDGTRQELREAREDRDSLRARLIAAESAAAAREPETRGCSYTDAVTLFRRDPSASWTCDELQKNHGPDARCRFSQEEARMMFAHPGGFYSGPYMPTRAEALATDWRRVEAKTEAARPPREYPLAEGSRWDGDEIVDLDGTRTSAVGRTGGAHIWCVGPWGEKRFPRLENVLALAHRRGLV